MKNAQIVICPSGSGTTPCGAPFRSDWGDEAGENREWTTLGHSYGFSIVMGNGGGSIGNVLKPSERIMLGESGGTMYAGNCGNYSGCPYNMTVNGCRHNGGANATFYDGHSKWTKKSQYIDPVSWYYANP